MRREIAVLRKMEHPCVARLVASFRWRDGAYLVLEYAAKGDLFTQVRTRYESDKARLCTRVVIKRRRGRRNGRGGERGGARHSEGGTVGE